MTKFKVGDYVNLRDCSGCKGVIYRIKSKHKLKKAVFCVLELIAGKCAYLRGIHLKYGASEEQLKHLPTLDWLKYQLRHAKQRIPKIGKKGKRDR